MKQYTLSVPVSLSVTVSGVSLAKAKQMARAFAESLEPSAEFIKGYNDEIEEGEIVRVGFESSREESVELLDEEDILCECGREESDCKLFDGGDEHGDR